MKWTTAGVGRGVGLIAGSLMLFACGDSPFEVIEEVEFAASLNIDLAQMTRTSSGLYYQDIVVGTGDPAVGGSVVELTYTGRLRTGSQFDAGGFPLTLGSGQVIPGFDEGVRGMRAGGERLIVIPPELAYADQAAGAIPAGSILIFNIQVVSIQ